MHMYIHVILSFTTERIVLVYFFKYETALNKHACNKCLLLKSNGLNYMYSLNHSLAEGKFTTIKVFTSYSGNNFAPIIDILKSWDKRRDTFIHMYVCTYLIQSLAK